MINIIPAVLGFSIDELESQAKKIPEHIPSIHIDIADGVFVSEKYLYSPDELVKIFPNKKWEIHLMVSNPEKHISTWGNCKNVERIIFHIEATQNPADIVKEITHFQKKSIIALNPETDYKAIVSVMPYIQGIQLMSVHPGTQGKNFIENTSEKIDMLRGYLEERGFYDTIEIAVDGGITSNTISSCVFYGASHFCVGSFLMKAPNFEEAYKELEQAIQNT